MTTRPAARLRAAVSPGGALSLEEAAEAAGGKASASAALSYLRRRGEFVRVRQGLWVRAGGSVDPYRLGARITSPYAFSYGTALALHGAAPTERFEVLVSSPRRFDAFGFEAVSYRRAMPWVSEGIMRVPVGPEFVWTTTPERTLVECVRVPSNAGGAAELLRIPLDQLQLRPHELLGWVDHFGEAVVAARLGFLLEDTSALSDELYPLLAALEERRPASRLYLDPANRGGHLRRRWNLIVPDSVLTMRSVEP